ncbi:MAG: aldo/keto reductase, partial [Dehalococcoidia bacterium]
MDLLQRVSLGRSSLQVPRLGLGTVAIGGLFGTVTEEEAHALIRRSYELGLRLFDTAPIYGFGLAESRLGQVLPDLPRSEYVVSTKVGRLLRPMSAAAKTAHILREAVSLKGEGIKLVTEKVRRVAQRLTKGTASGVRLGYPFDQGTGSLVEVWDFSYDGAMRSLESSLKRLKLDRVDIVMIHDPDHHYAEALNGAYRALERLRREGVVSAIGVGMRQSAMMARFAGDADFDCFLLAGRYTLLDQSALADLLPLCLEKQISIVIGGVFNSGILVDPKPGVSFDYKPATQERLARALRLRAVCERYDVPLPAAAMQFPL